MSQRKSVGYVSSQFCVAAHVGRSLMSNLCCVADSPWSGGSRGNKDMEHPPGATQTHSVTAAERQPCDFVFVHRARLEGKTSIVTFALGLLVLKEQIFLSEGMLQTLTLTLEWITKESTDKGLNADTAANARSKFLEYSIIIYGGYCLFLWKA